MVVLPLVIMRVSLISIFRFEEAVLTSIEGNSLAYFSSSCPVVQTSVLTLPHLILLWGLSPLISILRNEE